MPFQLDSAEIHVWPVRLTAADSVVDEFHDLLDSAESSRGARFRFPHLRRSFTLSRGSLRLLIGRYAGVNPQEIRFRTGPKGKPALDLPACPLQFNASHSGDRFVVAIARGCEVGVDVEHVRPLEDMMEIAGRFFSPEEAQELRTLEPGDRQRAFFSCWTRKEAYVKAIGEGLSVPLHSFRVTLRPGDRTRIVHFENDSADAVEWCLHDIALGPEYTAALAYRGQLRTVRLMPLTEPSHLAAVKPSL